MAKKYIENQQIPSTKPRLSLSSEQDHQNDLLCKIMSSNQYCIDKLISFRKTSDQCALEDKALPISPAEIVLAFAGITACLMTTQTPKNVSFFLIWVCVWKSNPLITSAMWLIKAASEKSPTACYQFHLISPPAPKACFWLNKSN